MEQFQIFSSLGWIKTNKVVSMGGEGGGHIECTVGSSIPTTLLTTKPSPADKACEHTHPT